MKNNKNIIYLAITSIMVIIFALNCVQNTSLQKNEENANNDIKKYGKLNITIVNVQSRTILPEFTAVNHYDMTGDGPDGNTISIENITGTTQSVSSLLAGSWNLTVLGKDASGNTIARGTAGVTIIEDATTDVSITVNYLQEESGGVNLTINWPGTIPVDSVILQINNEPTSDIFVGGNSVNYNNSNKTSGFYLYIFKIKSNGKLIASVFESVHIYDYLATNKTIELLTTDFKSAPTAPSGLTASEGTGKIVLNWTDNTNIETGFIVERSETSGSGFTAIGGTDATPLSANTTTFEDTTAVAGTTYNYRVKAVNSFGSSGYSNEVSSVLNIPEILSIYPSSNSTSIELSSNITIVFNQTLNNSVKGNISFNNPAIIFEDTINCIMTFIKSNVTDDTILIEPNSNLLENITYSNITITGFTDTTGNYMLSYNNPAFNFKTVDLTAPPAPTISIDPVVPTNGDVTVTINYSPDSVIKQYKIGTGSYTDYTGSFIVSDNCIIYAQSKDASDNWSNEGSLTITNIDKILPTATVSYSTTSPTNGDVTATITPSESVTITNNDGLATYTFTANGSFTFNFSDPAGNTGSVTATVSNIDKTSPVDPIISINPTTPTTGDVTVTITFSGDSTVKQYKIGTGSYQNYTAPFTVSNDTTIYAKAQDSVGNWSAEVDYDITNIDKGNLTVNINLITPTEYTINFGAFDGELDKNSSEELNVTATLDSATSWEWYLDGDSLGITTASCLIDSASYDPGPYSLTVFATKDGVLYSGTIEFSIVN